MSDYNPNIAKYSELVNDDNRFPEWIAGKRRAKMSHSQMFSTKQRSLALLSAKRRFETKKEMQENFDFVLSKFSKLPAGTHFSVGSLFSSADKAIAQCLGKMVAKDEVRNPNFRFVTAYTGKWIYCRTDKNPELVEDFEVTLPFVS